MKKTLLTVATVALMATSAFGVTNECKEELMTLKKDLSNLTDKGAECLAENITLMMNNALAKQASSQEKMNFAYKNKTVIMQMSTTSTKEKKITKEQQSTLIKNACKNPLYRGLMQHGIKWKIDMKIPQQHAVVDITDKVCKQNNF